MQIGKSMREGKISENVLKRSVLNKIKTYRKETINGAGIGKDCAILSFGDGWEAAAATTFVTAPMADLCGYAIPMALNNVAAAGAEPVGVLLGIMLPEQTEESALQELMEQAETVCAGLNVEIVGGHTEIIPAVKKPVVTVTGIGKREKAQAGFLQRIDAGQDIIVSKWIGLEGTARLARERKEELCTRYPIRMIEEAAEFRRFLSVIPEAATAVKSGVCGMHDVSRGGIFGALWEMASGAGVGLKIDLKKLPVRQETIEICEFFGLNPYELLSGGCLIMVAEDGDRLVNDLLKEQIPAVIVGQTCAGNDRIICNGEETRYLDMPKMDQIYNIRGGAS